MQCADIAERLDGLDGRSVGLNGEEKTGARRDAVDQDGAGSAHAMLAAHMRSRQTEVVSKEVAQQQTRLDITLIARAVHSHRDVLFGHLPSSRSFTLPSGKPIVQYRRSSLIISSADAAGSRMGSIC
jgi:hypothetical protein